MGYHCIYLYLEFTKKFFGNLGRPKTYAKGYALAFSKTILVFSISILSKNLFSKIENTITEKRCRLSSSCNQTIFKCNALEIQEINFIAFINANVKHMWEKLARLLKIKYSLS